MSTIDSPLEIYRFLPKTNCRQCQVPTCLAFAAAVIKGLKQLGDCPHVDGKTVEGYSGRIEVRKVNIDQQQEKILEQLRGEVAGLDLSAAGKRLGASLRGDSLVIKCLGKPFFINAGGNVTSDIHINPWVLLPLLNYIAHSPGINPSGKWVPFRELKNGSRYNPLFDQRCEKPLKKMADKDMDLLKSLLSILGGRPAEVSFDTDMALALLPLPKVPMLICYSSPEEDIESRLNIFFDITVDDNLTSEAIYFLIAGLVVMLEKMTLRHGQASSFAC
ncbi:MAG: Fe-S cluster protein [Peptococcaceae bacterium BICA1-7]|nr:MAG: Fe-S cluster protein [Peptococcaceae bacterium BICA1-7]HBV98529.1 DUF3786 domain-containing protein [Desulfotomaculum sp.]